MNIALDPEQVIGLLQQLVRINSVNPSLVPGGHGEGEIAAFVARQLEAAGLEAQLQEAAPGRPNVIGRLRGRGGGRTLILNAHLDTVSTEGMDEPFSGRIEGGRLYGRGAMDTKAGLAAGLATLLALRRAGVTLAGDLVLAGTADEEYASIGTEALVCQITGDGCIILEPTGLGLAVAHGGFVWAEIETTGVAAHGSAPDAGVDAIVKMGHVLTELGALGERIHREKVFFSPLAQETMHPSVHASLIQGGRELSSYPDRCLLQIERRLIPGETVADLEAELDGVIARLAAEDPQFRAQRRTTFVREPWQATQGPLLAALDQACIAELGAKPAYGTSMGWMDSALTQAAGIETAAIGPSGDGAHGLVEYVDLDSVIACTRILIQTAISYCNGEGS